MKQIKVYALLPFSLFCLLVILGLLSSCSGGRKITVQGLKHAKIGDPMPAFEKKRFKNYSVTDTLFQEEGYQWEVRILSNTQGSIYLEGGFFGDSSINRIRVETPEYQVKKRISVGMSADELKSFSENWYVSYLEVYQKLDVSAAEMPSVHFLFEVAPNFMEGRNPEETLTFMDLNPKAQIVSIVVM